MNTIRTEKRACQACGNTLRGRADKKFCNDYCRNHFNNELKAKRGYSPCIRNINTLLLRNRKILAEVLTETGETVKARRDKLLQLGFHFKYLTHHTTTRTGKIIYYCYDYGYRPLENDCFLIVKKKEE
ncbi:MAG: hypothetical protein HYZ15_15490 [Sphingobacteriales bacterium]|nr:hypothetical protein [Sphingobacteriales bacterium]